MDRPDTKTASAALLDALRRKLASAAAPAPSDRPVPEGEKSLYRLPGGEVHNEAGRFWLAETRHSLADPHGRFPLFTAGGPMLEGVRRALKLADLPHPPESWLFLDIETDGLTGGAGCHAFLIGCAWLEGGQAVVRRYLMRDYDEEAAMLTAFSDLLKQFEATVTFNGKTFDLGVLDARFTINRMPPEASRPDAYDLLHAARRVWRRRLPDCRMETLERAELGLFRTNDTPGHLIPALYYRFITTGDASLLDGPMKHNLLDVLSLPALTARLGQLFEPGSTVRRSLPAPDLFGMAKTLAAQSAPDAEECFREAMNAARGGLKNEIRATLSLYLKRLGETVRAKRIWLDMIEDREIPAGPFPYEELAKRYEHGEKNCREALTMTEMGLRSAESHPARPLIGRSSEESLRRRLRRLERKLEAAGQPSVSITSAMDVDGE